MSGKSTVIKNMVSRPYTLIKKETHHIQKQVMDLWRPESVWLLGGIDHNNLGDHQIVESMKEFLGDIQPGIVIHEIAWSEYFDRKPQLLNEIKTKDILLFCGGGNLGTIWPRTEQIRRDAFAVWQKNRQIVFPQSMYFEDSEVGRKELEISRLTYRKHSCIMALRDKTSFSLAKANFGCELFLTPDMAFYSHIQNHNNARHGCLLMLREDKERQVSDLEAECLKKTVAQRFDEVRTGDTVLDHSVGSTNRHQELEALYGKITSSELVVTDRLHGMILSAISATPCVVLPNSYHKIQASMDWVNDLPYIRYLDHPDHLGELLRELDLQKTYEYPCAEMRTEFREFRDAVARVLAQR